MNLSKLSAAPFDTVIGVAFVQLSAVMESSVSVSPAPVDTTPAAAAGRQWTHARDRVSTRRLLQHCVCVAFMVAGGPILLRLVIAAVTKKANNKPGGREGETR